MTECHNRYGRHAILSRMVTGEEVVGADRSSVRLIQVSLHLDMTGVAAKVFVVPLASSHTALTSRMIRDVNKTIHTEFF